MLLHVMSSGFTKAASPVTIRTIASHQLDRAVFQLIPVLWEVLASTHRSAVKRFNHRSKTSVQGGGVLSWKLVFAPVLLSHGI